MSDFELRYIHPVWDNNSRVISIEKSDRCIEVDKNDSEYYANTLAYIRILNNEMAYVGIKLLDKTDVIPFVELASGEHLNLEPVSTPNDGVWWIIASAWKTDKNRYDTDAFNRIGIINIYIGEAKLVLTNEASNFSYEDLQKILDDFKIELWQLLIDKDSMTSTSVTHNSNFCLSLNEDCSLIDKFLNGLDKLLKIPDKKLIEITEKVPKNKVKATKDTFIALVKNPLNKLLPSRGFTVSHDTVSNRYLHFCLNRVIYLMNIYLKITDRHKYYLQHVYAQAEIDKINYYKKGIFSLNKDVLDNQIDELQAKIKKLESQLCDSVIGVPGSILKIKINKIWGNTGGKKRFCVVDGLNIRPRYKYTFLVLPDNWFLSLKENDFSDFEFTICANYHYDDYCSQNNTIGLKISFCDISSVSISSKTLNLLKKIKNPEINLNQEDLKFIENEIRKSDANLKLLRKEYKEYLNKQKKTKSLLVKAKKISDRFNKMNIGIQDRFPQSIHFVADTRYRNLYSIYKEITTRRGGINDNIIYQMEQIEKIGVIQINEIYEYWCLISIIKVLVAKLKFSIKDNNWIQKLIDIILSKGKNQRIAFNFEHEYDHKPIAIRLCYQYPLQSNKRPDFILHLKSEKKDDEKYLVMDAKFRGNISNEQIEKDIKNLFDTKNYSGGGKHPVFILHSSKTAMNNNRKKLISFSPLSWGRFCSYGGEKDLNHMKGHILLIPLSTSIDNLQRLIGCFLQQNSYLRSNEEILIDSFMEQNSRWLPDDARYNRSFQKMNSYLLKRRGLLHNYNNLQQNLRVIVEQAKIIEHRNIICISCGSHNIKKELKFTEADREKYILTCNDCGLRSINTSCYNCSRKKLYKNGLWWTYHITVASQVSNIVCPSCGAYLLNTYDDSDYLENNDFE